MRNKVYSKIKNGLRFLGFELKRIKRESKNKSIALPFTDEFNNYYNIVKPYTMLSSKRLYNIYCSIEYLNGEKIDGSFIECGVWKGGSVGMMALKTKGESNWRELHLFDAFDDICQPDSAVDGQRAIEFVGGAKYAQGMLEPVKGIYDYKGGAGNYIECENLIVNTIGYPKELVNIHVGWFQETLKEIDDKIEKIALLRLDADWYSSTKICLEALYKLLVSGGIIIIDDYLAYEGCMKAVNEFRKNEGIKELIHYVDEECIYWIKR